MVREIRREIRICGVQLLHARKGHDHTRRHGKDHGARDGTSHKALGHPLQHVRMEEQRIRPARLPAKAYRLCPIFPPKGIRLFQRPDGAMEGKRHAPID